MVRTGLPSGGGQDSTLTGSPGQQNAIGDRRGEGRAALRQAASAPVSGASLFRSLNTELPAVT